MKNNYLTTHWFRQKIGDNISWIALSKIRTSFLSKALTTFSIATFALSNFGALLHHLEINVWRLQCLFVGSILFLVGYVLGTIRIPSEFRDVTNIYDAVSRMSIIDDYPSFKGRRNMTDSLVRRMEKSRPFDLEKHSGPLLLAKSSVAETKNVTEEDWRPHAASLYHADLVLRQYDRPVARLIALALIGGGILLFLIPTFASAVGVIRGQLTE